MNTSTYHTLSRQAGNLQFVGNNMDGFPHILPVNPQGQLPADEVEASRLAEVVLHAPLAYTFEVCASLSCLPRLQGLHVLQGLLTPTIPAILAISITFKVFCLPDVCTLYAY